MHATEHRAAVTYKLGALAKRWGGTGQRSRPVPESALALN
jgi:hypothetical protein